MMIIHDVLFWNIFSVFFNSPNFFNIIFWNEIIYIFMIMDMGMKNRFWMFDYLLELICDITMCLTIIFIKHMILIGD